MRCVPFSRAPAQEATFGIRSRILSVNGFASEFPTPSQLSTNDSQPLTDAPAEHNSSSAFEAGSLPTLTRSYPRRLIFYVAHPIRSIHCFNCQRFSFSPLETPNAQI